MAATLNGIGTSYRGVGAPDDKGWRPATKWFVFLYMPVFPLKRVVLRPLGETRSEIGLGESTLHFEMLPGGWIRPGEVLLTYLIFWGLILPVALGPLVASIAVLVHFKKIEPSWIWNTAFIVSLIWLAAVGLYVGIKGEARLLPAPGSRKGGAVLDDRDRESKWQIDVPNAAAIRIEDLDLWLLPLLFPSGGVLGAFARIREGDQPRLYSWYFINAVQDKSHRMIEGWIDCQHCMLALHDPATRQEFVLARSIDGDALARKLHAIDEHNLGIQATDGMPAVTECEQKFAEAKSRLDQLQAFFEIDDRYGWKGPSQPT